MSEEQTQTSISEVFRQKYRDLPDNEAGQVEVIKITATQLLNEINGADRGDNGREIALAKTKLEECVMWAVKGITK